MSVAQEREQQFQRLLSLTARLLGSQGLSVRELGGHDSASRRRIQRDLVKLRECGLPLHSTEGQESVPRYRLENLRLAGGQLDLFETLALTLTTSLAGNTDLGQLARQGWSKLHYTVLNGQERTARNDLPHLVSSRVTWDLPAAVMEAISQSLIRHRRLRMFYFGLKDSEPRWREVEPWMLFFQDRWYLHAWDPSAKATRNFRLDRIHAMSVLDDVFDPPPAHRLSDPHFHRWDLLDQEPTEVVCRVDTTVARWLAENPAHPSQQLEGEQLRLSVRDPEAFVRWAMGLSRCDILEPSWLRQRQLERLREMLSRLDGATS
jgi:proteasome accessory factor C